MSTTSCKTCFGGASGSIIDVKKEQIQKSILHQSKVSQSLYIQNISSLNNNINTNNEGVKYDSYQRYLLKKKRKVFTNQSNKKSTTPLQGNKTQSFSLTNKVNNNCNFCG